MTNELRVQLSESGADAERLDTLTRYLRQELLQLDVGDVTALQAGAPPPGTRAIDAGAIGGLVVTLHQSAQSFVGVIASLRLWLRRGDGIKRTIRLELDGDVLELSQVSLPEQDRLVDLFVNKHSRAGE
jgi:hypothetical protein